MAGAGDDDANFGAGRGSGTESDGKGATSPREAPSEAHAARAKAPMRITINPRVRPDMSPSHEIEHPTACLILQKHKNTARIGRSHKIQRLW
jgi:hypothetical protein